MSYLEITALNLTLPGFELADININLPKGKSLVILGPSGSGKSVLLEAIAGFARPSSGTIRLDGRDITQLPPEARQLGFMFQDYALFPHYTVQENVLFSRRFGRKTPREGLDPGQIMGMLGIDHLANRHPATLSGGERQRVALARAMVQQPDLFLFDEPMSALDAKTREELQEELRHMQRELSLTAIYVTHNHLEAQILGDFICLLHNGRLIQTGSQAEVYNHPRTEWAAQFVGMHNLWPGQVLELGHQMAGKSSVRVYVEGLGTLHVASSNGFAPGDQVWVGIRPEDIVLDLSPGTSTDKTLIDSLTFKIKGIMPWGAVYKLYLQGPVELTAYGSKQQLNGAQLKEGDSIQVGLPPGALHLIEVHPQ